MSAKSSRKALVYERCIFSLLEKKVLAWKMTINANYFFKKWFSINLSCITNHLFQSLQGLILWLHLFVETFTWHVLLLLFGIIFFVSEELSDAIFRLHLTLLIGTLKWNLIFILMMMSYQNLIVLLIHRKFQPFKQAVKKKLTKTS